MANPPPEAEYGRPKVANLGSFGGRDNLESFAAFFGLPAFLRGLGKMARDTGAEEEEDDDEHKNEASFVLIASRASSAIIEC